MCAIEKKDNKQIIREQFWPLFLVQFFSIITSSIGDVVNSIIVGNALSTAELAALGLCLPLGTFISAIASLFAAGVQITSGREIGRGDLRKLSAVFSTSIAGAAAAGVVLNLLMILISGSLAKLLGATPELIEDTALYIRGYGFAAVPIILTSTLVPYLQLGNSSSCALISALIQAVANLLFALLAVTVLEGNLMSVGLATALASWAGLVYIIICFATDKKLIKFKLKLMDIRLLGTVVLCGLCMGLSVIMASIREILMNNQLAIYGGTTELAASSIMHSLVIIQDAIMLGGFNALAMHISVAAGEKDAKAFEDAFRVDYQRTIFMLAAVTLILWLCGTWAAGLFGADAGTAGLTNIFLAEYHIGQTLFAIMFLIIPVYQSIGYNKLVLTLNLLMALPLYAVFIYTLPLMQGASGVFAAYIGGGLLAALCVIIVPTIVLKHFPRSIKDVMLIRDDFGIDKSINIAVSTEEEVCRVSKEVSSFFEENGIDRRRAMLSGLCLEEMAGNIVTHGFAKSKKAVDTLVINIFVAVDGEDLIIRLHDNAPQFNPYDRLANGQINPKDPAKNMGIRMVSKIAKEMTYQSNFGKNVIAIKM